MKAWIAVLVLLALAAPSFGGVQHIKEYVLFGGGNVDSLEQVSPWIYVRGANRVEIQTWSAKAAFHPSTDADSTYTDSIAVFKIGFSDSLIASSPTGIAADSVILTTATVTTSDTTTKMAGVSNPPLQEALRGPGNGSGIYTTVYATAPGNIAVYGDGSIRPKYMRVYITPHRRMTVTGGQSTAGKRVNGLKGLRMRAFVITQNK